MSTHPSSFAVGIDFEHVLAAISKQIYETPLAFLRENVQNAVDAIRIQAQRDGVDSGDARYRVDVSIDGTKCVIRDNGIGMTAEDLRRLFWTIGASGKRNDEARRAGCVGMFGIGGFANLGVCSKLEVISQVAHESHGTATWLSEQDIRAASGGIPHVRYEVSDAAGPRGTVVVGHLRKPPDVGELQLYLTEFVQFAKEMVYFDGKLVSGQSLPGKERPSPAPPQTWTVGDIRLTGAIHAERAQTLGAALASLVVGGRAIPFVASLRFENGVLDVYKRGFKLCATKIVTHIGVSGRVDCDEMTPTAGRDSLDAPSMALLQKICGCMERAAILEVLKSSDLIAQHTRIFPYIMRHGLVEQIGNARVRLADGVETTLERIRLQAVGGTQVFFGSQQRPSLSQVMQARGHSVVILDSDRQKQAAERQYLERYCRARPMDGVVTCTDVYRDLTRFEQAFLSEVEFTVSTGYQIQGSKVTPAKLTEDLPVFVNEDTSAGRLEFYLDVRHPEITKLQVLGITPLFYSMVSAFCSEYLGQTLRKYSPKYFGSGGVNLDLLAKKRSELWVLLKDDVQVISRPKQRDVVRSGDVQTVRVGAQAPPTATESERRVPKILRIIEEDGATGIGGAYIKLPESTTKAYGDLIKEAPYRGVIWAGNKVLFVASDGVHCSFQFEVRLDQLVGGPGVARHGMEGAAELARPVQEMYSELYFPMATELEASLIPEGDREVRIEVNCDWLDMETSKAWGARTSA